tara:strand:+ start:358 stop:1617 length:1260 start_codon:yes stop_codon:yes gene_type:complete
MIEYSELIRNFLFALIIGAFIGIEREYAKKRDGDFTLGGIRTFILISIVGALSGYFSQFFGSLLFLLFPFLILSLFILINYYIVSKKSKEIHMTTGICGVLVFILSAMVFYGFGKFAIALSILIAVLLSSRHYLHEFISKIEKKELQDTLKFAIIALVILPFLPNKAYGPLSILNPYLIWLMVVFISAISFFGYILVKIFGAKRGISITGLVGGLVSSTAVTMTFANKSKKVSKLFTNAFSLAIIIASSTMFLRILFEILVVNRALLSTLIIPLGLMTLTGAGFSYYYYKIKKEEKSEKLELKSPFTLNPAIKFGLFFAFILFISKAAQIYLGSAGIYLTSLLSGLADVDAITLSMANLAANNTITEKVATSAITLAALSNTFVKGGIVYFAGSKELRKKIIISFGSILIVGLLSILLF